MKVKTRFVCSQCAASFSQWSGLCTHCGAWNSIAEEQVQIPNPNSNNRSRLGSYANEQSKITLAEDVTVSETQRLDTGLTELNRVLGGGLVDGSVVLIGGDPGVGKSTVLLQTLAHLSTHESVLYVT